MMGAVKRAHFDSLLGHEPYGPQLPATSMPFATAEFQTLARQIASRALNCLSIGQQPKWKCCRHVHAHGSSGAHEAASGDLRDKGGVMRQVATEATPLAHQHHSERNERQHDVFFRPFL